jgi:hypothetical protein
VSGFFSKRKSADVRWLGPYAPTDRHADDTTLDHIVELRNRIMDMERLIVRLEDQRDKAMSLARKCERLQEEMLNSFYLLESLELSEKDRERVINAIKKSKNSLNNV